MSIVSNLVSESNGSKRGLSGIISALGLILSAIPGFGTITTVLVYLGGLFGFTGLAHAGKEGTVLNAKTSTLAAIFSVALSICYAVPSLNVYAPLVQEIAGLLGVGVATMAVTKPRS